MRIADQNGLILTLALLLGAGCSLDRPDTPAVVEQPLEATRGSQPPAQPENAFSCALECADQHDLCLAGCTTLPAVAHCKQVCDAAFEAGLTQCDVRYPPSP